MKNSSIEWTHHTVNFWWGCDKVSPACANCYAETISKIFSRRIFGRVIEWGQGKVRGERLAAARKECLALERRAAKTGGRTLVFVNSMSDWLDEEAPIEWLAELLDCVHLCPSLTFQLLTKRPENWAPRIEAVLKLIESHPSWGDDSVPVWPRHELRDRLADWFVLHKAPANIWIGTTVEDQERAAARILHLLSIPAKVRFLSCEPLLGPADLWGARYPHANGGQCGAISSWHGQGEGIHWVICGGESGHGSRPMHPDWARSLRDQCAAAGVAFFMKQMGGPRKPFPEIPADLIVRQFPELAARDCWAVRPTAQKKS